MVVLMLSGAMGRPGLAQAEEDNATRRAAKEWIEQVGGTFVENPETGELAVTLVQNSELQEVTPLVALPKITELTLASQIEIELNTLVGLPRLRVLSLSMPNSNLTPLAGLAGLETLSLRVWHNHDPFEDRFVQERPLDLTPLAGLEKLRELRINANGRTIDLEPLRWMHELALLDLAGTQLDSITPLAGMTGLEEIRLQLNGSVTNLDPLAELTQMRNLWICGHSVRDASALAGMKNLERVFIQLSREYSDLSCFAEMANLRDLDITACYGCSDLTPLAGLSQLERISLVLCSSVKDLTPLAELEQLKTLDLRAAEITNLEPIAELQQRGLNVVQ